MRGIIAAPKKIITGAFNVNFAFIEDTHLAMDSIFITTLEGDALGHPKDTFGGHGKHYHLICYLPDARAGKSRISVIRTGVDVQPVIVEYDTVRVIHPVWGTPLRQGSKTEIPLTFPDPVVNLRKRNFQVSKATNFRLYGTGQDYQFVVSDTGGFSVTVSGAITKANGLDAVIQETVIDV